MIECYLKSESNGRLSKESVGAWIFSLLSSRYHDDGLNDYFNGSKVKAHSYYIENEVIEKELIVKIEIRGISQLENIIEEKLINGSKVRIGNLHFKVYHVERVDLETKKVYEIKTPIIMREHKKVYKYEQVRKPINELLMDSIKRKYKLIYGEELIGLKSLAILNKKEQRLKIKIKGEEIEHKGYIGKVEIVGNDEAINFILSVGLGNRTTYGYGVLG